MGFRILLIGAVLALACSLALGQDTTSQPTAIVVAPPAVVPMVSSPFVTTPIVTTPSVHFENGPNGTTIPVVTNSAVVTQTVLPASASAPVETASSNSTSQIRDLNLGSESSISEIYGGDNRGVAEIARQYKQRRNGVQNARVYTNADIARIRQQEGGGSSAIPANDQQGAMPASDQSAEQNQSTTPQVQQPAANQKPSPFAPKK
jgi:hypothetical protein